MDGSTRRDRRASTEAEDAAAAAVSVWIVVAIHLDGRAHVRELPDSFFTWWHLLLYSGVGAAFALLALMLVRGQPPGHARSAARLPSGYGWSGIGVLLLAAAGVSDLLWHSVFGVEEGIDALLSPTHLLLFTGALLMFAGPIRADGATGRDPRQPWRIPAVLAAGSIAAVTGFALSYLSAFTTDAPLHAVLRFPEGTAEHTATEIPAVAGLGSYVVTSLVLVVPLAVLVRRRPLPFGAATGYLGALAALAITVQDFTRPGVVVAAVGAGLVVDIALAVATHRGSPATRTLTVGIAVPVTIWPAQLLALQVSEAGVNWSPELVGGVVVASTLIAAATTATIARPGLAESASTFRPSTPMNGVHR